MAHPGDLTQASNSVSQSSASRKSSFLVGSTLGNEDASSGSESKGTK